nr:MAG TPA: hypothetical protein [Caudoviricetes sp.]
MPYLYIDKISVVFGIYDMGSENSGYIVRACEDIMKEVEEHFQLYG